MGFVFAKNRDPTLFSMATWDIEVMRDQIGKLYDAILTAKTAHEATRTSVRERANARMGVAARPGAPRYLP